ncbi:hypothetical protein [Pseudoxanthomonas putridarboris]|uniref:Transcription termination factor nusG n=1 Tax=Pseudoxanthomonas putridarboris TaxID=752605 RepID=A0ABU9J1X7_9GAMM
MARWYKLHTFESETTKRRCLKYVLEVWDVKEPLPMNWVVPNAGRLLALLFKEELIQRLSARSGAITREADVDEPRKRRKKKGAGNP